MKTVREMSYLIDYLKSFELINQQEELKTEDSVLDQVIDAAYKEKIVAYVESLAEGFDQTVIQYFIGDKFNLLFSINKFYKLQTFEDLAECLSQLSTTELLSVVAEEFDLAKDFNLLTLESLPLSFKDKWQLAFISKEFEGIRQTLVSELRANYMLYKEYADSLYEDYGEKIQEVFRALREDDLYDLVFSERLNPEEFEAIEQRLVLLISANTVMIYAKESYELIALGLYVKDYYLAIERQKKMDEVELIQVLKTLADPTRYAIIKHINRGITANSVLADKLSVSRAAISMQFKQLQANELMTVDETTKQYVLNKELIRYALEKVQMDLDL